VKAFAEYQNVLQLNVQLNQEEVNRLYGLLLNAASPSDEVLMQIERGLAAHTDDIVFYEYDSESDFFVPSGRTISEFEPGESSDEEGTL